jgi:hypothetical protein
MPARRDDNEGGIDIVLSPVVDLVFPDVAKAVGPSFCLATIQWTCDERKNSARPLRRVAGRSLPRAGERSGKEAGSAAT